MACTIAVTLRYVSRTSIYNNVHGRNTPVVTTFRVHPDPDFSIISHSRIKLKITKFAHLGYLVMDGTFQMIKHSFYVLIEKYAQLMMEFLGNVGLGYAIAYGTMFTRAYVSTVNCIVASVGLV